MEKGLAIIEATDTETKVFFIDQDVLECARLNALTKKRLAKAEAKQREAAKNRRRAEKAEARRKAYTVKTIKTVCACCGACGAVVWAGTAGLVHPIIFIPVGLICLCAACLRLGVWLGKWVK